MAVTDVTAGRRANRVRDRAGAGTDFQDVAAHE